MLDIFNFLYMFFWFMTGLFACEFHYNKWLKQHHIINAQLLNGKEVFYK